MFGIEYYLNIRRNAEQHEGLLLDTFNPCSDYSIKGYNFIKPASNVKNRGLNLI